MSRNFVDGNWRQFKGNIHEPVRAGEGAMSKEIPPRRIVLRGALAVGCGLWIPMALSGCDSKKGANSTSAPAADSPAPRADSAAPAASKVTQTSVQYQAQPKGEQKCSGCVNFMAGSNSCKLVEGQISPEGWCSLWTKKG